MDEARSTGVVLMKCQGFEGPCEAENAKPKSCMTAYHWDGTGPNPNLDPVLCADCHAAYVAYWQERWDEYFGVGYRSAPQR